MRSLVVSATAKGGESLCALISEYEGRADIITCQSASQARRIILDSELDVVVINVPLSDESGEELAVMVTEQSLATSILVVRNEYFEQEQMLYGSRGVLVVQKPVIKQIFFQTLALGMSMHRRLTAMRNENEKLHRRIEEIKVIERAKWALIKNLGMDENQAHRHIEKQAMDLRKSRYDVASLILNTYENQ